MKRFQKLHRSAGFTLIELLVVIAIIAILAAILFPVFAKAREKARQITCASDEKQLALGFMQYSQDNDESFPGLFGDQAYWPKAVYPYVKSAQVFQCPDDPTDYANFGTLAKDTVLRGASGTANSVWQFSSYGMNMGLTNGNFYNGFPIAKINNPADTCLIAEDRGEKIANQCFGYFQNYNMPPTSNYLAGDASMWYANTLGDTPTNDSVAGLAGNGFQTPIARHTGGANIGFTDGHVKWMRFAAIYTLPTGVTDPKQFKLWHPDAQ